VRDQLSPTPARAQHLRMPPTRLRMPLHAPCQRTPTASAGNAIPTAHTPPAHTGITVSVRSIVV